MDARFSECRGVIPTGTDGAIALIASLISDSAAILILQGPIGPEGVDRWRDDLTARYGSVAPRREHGQESWQWVRRGRMIRLTTRVEQGNRIGSVTLVHGPLLDQLGPLPPPP